MPEPEIPKQSSEMIQQKVKSKPVAPKLSPSPTRTQTKDSKLGSFRAPTAPARKVAGGGCASGQKNDSKTERKRQPVKNEKTSTAKRNKGHVDNARYVAVKQSEHELLDTVQLCSRLVCECQKLQNQSQTNLDTATRLARNVLSVNGNIDKVEKDIYAIESGGLCSEMPLGISKSMAVLEEAKKAADLITGLDPIVSSLKEAFSGMEIEDLKKVADKLQELEKKILSIGEDIHEYESMDVCN